MESNIIIINLRAYKENCKLTNFMYLPFVGRRYVFVSTPVIAFNLLAVQVRAAVVGTRVD